MKIKLGDELVHTVDTVAEVGPNKILHKWIEFDISDDIVFLNGTIVIFYSIVACLECLQF
jgi:hypothetical protein